MKLLHTNTAGSLPAKVETLEAGPEARPVAAGGTPRSRAGSIQPTQGDSGSGLPLFTEIPRRRQRVEKPLRAVF